ncbi:uncharacterized protein LOC121372127 [Gigantopelta aegis]|uniref:uncharacterized protein LOC121372127 n=1 Tax=Gigantopelta aegis TaxID=1735272 RepID=UPI001B88979F|nr:uncharacterized protein LOC121372127 [Gigantopelta aegis]
MLLLCVALVVTLSATVNVNGQHHSQMGPPSYYVADWENEEECSVLCGTGLMPQIQRVKCVEYFTCSSVPPPNRRNVTCNTQPCGDTCPPGADNFVPHPSNPSRFYRCANEKAFLFRCPAPLVWGQKQRRCSWTWEVEP